MSAYMALYLSQKREKLLLQQSASTEARGEPANQNTVNPGGRGGARLPIKTLSKQAATVELFFEFEGLELPPRPAHYTQTEAHLDWR